MAETEEKLDPDMVKRGERVILVRKMLGMTQREFAKLCEAGFSTVCQWEHGRGSGLAEKSARTILRTLQDKTNVVCTLEWLLKAEGRMPYFKEESPAVGSPHTLAEFPIDNNVLSTQTAAFLQSDPRAMLLLVQDDAMAPLLKPGDYVGGYRISTQDLDLTPYIGELVLVQTVEGIVLIRRFMGRTAAGKYRFSVINPLTLVEPLTLEVELANFAVIARLWRPFIYPSVALLSPTPNSHANPKTHTYP